MTDPTPQPVQYHYVVWGEQNADGTISWAIDPDPSLPEGHTVWDPNTETWRRVNWDDETDRETDIAIERDLARRLRA